MLEKNKSNKYVESLAVLIDLIPDPVLIADSSGQIIAANRMIGKFTNYERDEIVGKTLSSFRFHNRRIQAVTGEKRGKQTCRDSHSAL